MRRATAARMASSARARTPSPFQPQPAETMASPPSASEETAGTSTAEQGAAKIETEDPILKTVFVDSFQRAALGPDWAATSSQWRIENGQACVRNARNHPLWLKRRIPVNARVEFDAVSKSSEGDIKAEFWGDGRSTAHQATYNDATSYLTIFGGWKNQFHVLARIDEHAKNRPEIRIDPTNDDIRARPVELGQSYHFKVERSDGSNVRWLVDDIELLTYSDPEPLKGAGHEHFGFNDWEVPVCFDNLKITPLP